MKLDACDQFNNRVKTLLRSANRAIGRMGYLATLRSIMTKSPRVMAPKIRRQITVGEFQGRVMPPNSRPKRNMSVPPMMSMVPSQSIVLRPAISEVLGVSILSHMRSVTRARPPNGTVEESNR
ncbi:hypothetical protein I7I53_04568 [Histoplasma capsulatum var. duboisii H88]|uniref:Uncharacterized protein n=1 Tax=Ajellomyces capsulatus (strain H88) TaxID=544711 RepID=A0A8A1LWR9_AJEC8|nr:hypothetical protein I7I53_04568 [Histoplasma capsulatum var. duboisii H88]